MTDDSSQETAMLDGWGGDEFEDLARPMGRPPTPGSAEALLADIVRALGEPPGRLTIVQDEGQMAWLIRDGRRLSLFNLTAAERSGAPRRAALVRAFTTLIRKYDEQQPVIEGLEVGKRYRLHYKNEEIRRIFRVKGVLKAVSRFRHAEGVAGAGWILTVETKPALYPAVTFDIDTWTLVDVEPI